MELLDNPIKSYAWGHADAISQLLGRAPNGQPEAELWLGAHPTAPSKAQATGEALDRLIAREPEAMLGPSSLQRFGPQLPYLLKVLAAAQPLSLQAHPSLAQAKAGFAREQAAGLALGAPTRNYKDPNHKPELICALTPFEALCGFRDLHESLALFDSLGVPVPTLAAHGLEAFFTEVMTASKAEQERLARAVAHACAQPTAGPFERERRWAGRLAHQYPGDVGLVGALLLNLVTLEPGDALYLPAGNLHAYLEGVGIELMASSDNVLRGGLTPKHVDVPELLRVLDFSHGPATVRRPMVRATRGASSEATYVTPAPDFELSRVTLVPGHPLVLPRRGADLWLVTEGTVQVGAGSRTVTLSRGSSLFAAFAEGPLTAEGAGLAFRATVGVW